MRGRWKYVLLLLIAVGAAIFLSLPRERVEDVAEPAPPEPMRERLLDEAPVRLDAPTRRDEEEPVDGEKELIALLADPAASRETLEKGLALARGRGNAAAESNILLRLEKFHAADDVPEPVESIPSHPMKKDDAPPPADRTVHDALSEPASPSVAEAVIPAPPESGDTPLPSEPELSPVVEAVIPAPPDADYTDIPVEPVAKSKMSELSEVVPEPAGRGVELSLSDDDGTKEPTPHEPASDGDEPAALPEALSEFIDGDASPGTVIEVVPVEERAVSDTQASFESDVIRLVDGGFFAEAVKLAMRTLRGDSGLEYRLSPDCLAALGVAFGEAGPPGRARRYFHRALDRESANRRALIGYARLLRREGSADAAIGQLRKYLAASPDDANAWLELAAVRALAGRNPASEYRRILELTRPDASGAVPPRFGAARAVALWRTGRTREATVLFKALAGETSGCPGSVGDHARELLEKGNYHEAAAELERTIAP